jgi:hypothetical protein
LKPGARRWRRYRRTIVSKEKPIRPRRRAHHSATRWSRPSPMSHIAAPPPLAPLN